MSDSTSGTVCEQNHMESLKSERKRIDTELQLSEEQQQILLEEKQLKEREEFIRQQEVYIYFIYLFKSKHSTCFKLRKILTPQLTERKNIYKRVSI